MNKTSYSTGSVLNLTRPKQAPQAPYPFNFCDFKTDETPSVKEEGGDIWVKLLELPSDYSHDEALLLCEHSDEEWVAWIPNHGEAILHTSQFCIPR